MFVHSADKLAEMRTKFHIIQAKLIMSVWCFTVQCWLTLDVACQGAQEPRHVAEDLVQHDREGGEGQPLGPRLQRGGGAAVTCQVHVTVVIDVM